MRVYRCFHDAELTTGEVIQLVEEEARHLASVRRVDVGDRTLVFNGRGIEVEGVVQVARKGHVEIELGPKTRETPPPTIAVELAPVITRTSDFDDMFERAIELGMTAFRPLESDHSVVKLNDSKRKTRCERWERLAVERIKQCERLWLPRIDPPASLETFLSAQSSDGPMIAALVEREEHTLPVLWDVAPVLIRNGICLLVGPEGGWSLEERQLLLENPNVTRVTMGPTILRAETACLAGLSSLLAHL